MGCEEDGNPILSFFCLCLLIQVGLKGKERELNKTRGARRLRVTWLSSKISILCTNVFSKIDSKILKQGIQRKLFNRLIFRLILLVFSFF